MSTSRKTSSEYDDAQFVEFLASLNLNGPEQDSLFTSSSPRTPSPRPSRIRGTVSLTPQRLHPAPTVYRFESPTKSGYTTEWFASIPLCHPSITICRAVAAALGQGGPDSSVRVVHQGSPRKGRKEAYAIFAGPRCGVFNTWYAMSFRAHFADLLTVIQGGARAEADDAFAYAQSNGLTRSFQSNIRHHPAPPTPSAQLTAQPAQNVAPRVAQNPAPRVAQPPAPHAAQLTAAPESYPPPLLHLPLHPRTQSTAAKRRAGLLFTAESILASILLCELECELNTSGIPNAMSEQVNSRTEALTKFSAAVKSGKVVTLNIL
ncbi:hypothetical protein R3P38DRAFT_3210864 [Favolaschia claudopus]|uniref:Uncharacterized protein n=1 Tax=Favolaschia claudopus TaxID=2862362 RepID=A0AAW0AI17_9AGAR